MIVHFAPDEKVVNRTVELFEITFPGKNEFIISYDKRNGFVNEEKGIVFFQNDDILSYKLKKGVQTVVFHSLTKPICNWIIQNKNINAKFYWIVWGADLYRFLGLKGYLNQYLTKPSFNRWSLRKLYFDKFRGQTELLFNFFRNRNSYQFTFENAYERIDFCCTFCQPDFELAIKYVNPHLQWKWFCYYPIDTILGDLVDQFVTNNDIIIGNSGAPTGNHKYIFKKLFEIKNNIDSKRIVVPLSYGPQIYIDEVKSYGYSLFKESFEPLTTFMPLEEYNKILMRCGIVFLPHLRQEAVGNVLISLHLGAKVFLFEKNPLFKFLNSLGLKVFTIDSLRPSDLNPLTKEVQLHNRLILETNFSSERVMKGIKELFS